MKHNQSFLLRETIVNSRRKQEANGEINLRPRVIQDKTKYRRNAKFTKRHHDEWYVC
jgi:hypothetical protein